ncbi:MAG: hypothetical protein ABUT39_03775 [Acidobacteriota bacterium]
MRARTILSLCCFLVLLLTGAALFAEPAPAPTAPFLDSVQAAPLCAAPALTASRPDLGGPTASAACPANIWQQCFQRYGTCTLCYCLSGSCFCENRCV